MAFLFCRNIDIGITNRILGQKFQSVLDSRPYFSTNLTLNTLFKKHASYLGHMFLQISLLKHIKDLLLLIDLFIFKSGT